LYSWICLLISIIICKVSEAKPTYYDLDSYENYDTDRYDSYGGSSSQILQSGQLPDKFQHEMEAVAQNGAGHNGSGAVAMEY